MAINSEYKKQIQGKTVSVIGIGVSNIPLIKFLLEAGAKVTAHDKRSAEDLGDVYTTLKSLGAKFVLGEEYLKNIPSDVELIFRTPGLRPDASELLEAKQ